MLNCWAVVGKKKMNLKSKRQQEVEMMKTTQIQIQKKMMKKGGH